MASNDRKVMRKTRRVINEPGHAHELTFSCFQRWPLLRDDRIKLWFVDAMEAARCRHGVRLWAYVIMPEHVHMLIHPRDYEYDVSAILKSIKQPVARKATRFFQQSDPNLFKQLRIVRPTGKVEHRFWQQGGGYDRNIVSPDVARSSIEYIEANPVRRGLAGLPTDWKWSSAQFHSGARDVPLKMDAIEL